MTWNGRMLFAGIDRSEREVGAELGPAQPRHGTFNRSVVLQFRRSGDLGSRCPSAGTVDLTLNAQVSVPGGAGKITGAAYFGYDEFWGANGWLESWDGSVGDLDFAGGKMTLSA